jgi:predicted Fe-Mo cluster-binding NifX family protein
MKSIIAIPEFENKVAPCFESATCFVIAKVENGRTVSIIKSDCIGCEGFERVRILRNNHVSILICNGIKNFYMHLIQAYGILVIRNISLPINEAIALHIPEKLKPEVASTDFSVAAVTIPLDDLICWTKDLFQSHGYKIFEGESAAPFPIDLVAEINCPVCKKPIRVAICCGAHAYRVDQEIKELHHVACTDFHSHIYIHPATPDIARLCEEYGIELIEPGIEHEPYSKSIGKIPILKKIIPGHEMAWKIDNNSVPHKN